MKQKVMKQKVLRRNRASSTLGILLCLLGLFCVLGPAPGGAAYAAEFAGTVVDPERRPVPGASVTLRCGGKVEKTARTDDRGRFELAVPGAPACQLEVRADGFRDRTLNVDAVSNDEPIALKLAAVDAELTVTSILPDLAGETVTPGRRLVEGGSGDLVDFMRQLGGSSAVRRGPVNLEPVIRGLQEDQIGAFVDGTRTFAAGPARMDSNLSHVGPAAVQSIRVVKGPYALAWGAGTLSAIEVDTFKPRFGSERETHGLVQVNYGENASRVDSSAAVWMSDERYRVYLSGGRRAGGDYEDGNGVSVPADFESNDFRWRLGFRPGERWLLEYSGGYQGQDDIDYPGRLLDATYFRARSHVVDLTWEAPDAGARFEGQVYANRKDHRMNNDEKPTAQPNPNRIPPFAIAVDLPTESNTAGGRLRVALSRQHVDWTFGVDAYQLEQNASRTVSRRTDGRVLFQDVVWPEAKIEDLGGYTQLVRRGERYQLGATVRVDQVEASAGTLSDFFLANTIGDPNQDETHLSAAFSSLFQLTPEWTLTFGVGRAVRTATVLERYSDRFPSTRFQIAAEFMGNPRLDPEESLEWNVGTQRRWGGVYLEAAAFYRQIDNYITVEADADLPRRLPLSPPVAFRYINGSEATFWGGELSLNHRVDERLSWRGTLAYVRADDALFDEPALGIAPLRGEVGVRYRFPRQRLWVDAEVEFADRQSRVAQSRFEQETPGYAIYNLASEFEVSSRWILRGWVENLTDRAYAQHLNAPNPFSGVRILEPGRQVRLGFQLSF